MLETLKVKKIDKDKYSGNPVKQFTPTKVIVEQLKIELVPMKLNKQVI